MKLKTKTAVVFFAVASCLAWAFPNKVPEQLKQAKWIWPYPYCNYDISNSYALFRTPVELKQAPKKATAYISADQSYMLYVNGELAARGPARGFQRSQPFDEIDVAKFLRPGKNVFAVRAYNPGRSTFSYITQGLAGVLFAYDIDGKVYASNAKTKSMRQNSCDRDTAPMSMQMNNQEHIDMRLDPVGWKDADFDDSAWVGSEGAKAYNYPPYSSLEERGIDMLEFKILPSPKIIGAGAGKSGFDGERIRNNFSLLDLEKADTKPVEANMPILVKPSADGQFSQFVVEFEKEAVGTTILEVEGAKGGEIIDLICDEDLTADYTPMHDYKSHSKPAMGMRLICRAGSFSHEFFQMAAYKKALVRVRNNKGDMKINLRMRWSAYPLQSNGVFKTSDELANKIWQTCAYTQRICALDSYVDTPWREQAQWWGDARVQAWNTFFISGDPRLLARGIHIIAMQVASDGLTYGHAPTMAHHCILPDFSLTWIQTMWDYYWQTGSIEPFIENKAVADGIFAYFKKRLSPRGLPTYDPLHWLFLDWTPIQKNGEPAILAFLYHDALDKAGRLAAAAGMTDEAKKYAAEAKKAKEAIEKNLLLSNGLICDGILPDGKQSQKTSIQAQILGRMANIAGQDFDKAKRQIILPYLRGERADKTPPSSFWVVYVFKQMVEEGHKKEVLDFIKKHWEPMVEFGTTFENYDGTLSRSHAWSAHPVFILPQIFSGIKQTAPAWADFEVNPDTSLADEAEIVWPTPRGDIKVSWKKGADSKPLVNIQKPGK